MTLRSALLVVAAVALALGCGRSREPWEGPAEALREEALASSRAFELVRALVVDVGPRFAGTPGDRAGVAWALQTMEDLGLENVRSEPVTVPRWIRGTAGLEVLEPSPHRLAITALGGSVATPRDGIMGEVVSVPDLATLEAADPDQIRGRIVFIDQSIWRAKDGAGYGEVGKIRRDGPSTAARLGASAVLIRSLATGSHRFPHTGSLKYADDAPQIPAVALAVPDADLLASLLTRGGPVRVHLDVATLRAPDVTSANVIGEIRGRERPDEIVLLGAHLDSWDLGHGAIDDGAGCAIVLEAARLIAARPEPPKRTVRVVLFANEEFGLSGAKAYAAAHAAEIERHMLALEADFGAGSVWLFATDIASGAVPFAQRVAAHLASLGVAWHGNGAAWGGADLRPLRELRVPVADLTQDGTYYFDYHHSADDTLDKIDPDELAQNAAAYVTLAFAAAEADVELRPGAGTGTE